MRKTDTEEEGDDAPGIEIPTPDVTLGEIDDADRHALIEEALRGLPESQRVPLVLYHFQDHSYEEIAGLLSVSLAKVKTDIHRGRAALERRLAKLGAAQADLL
jgi:RNA polymerase sigma-70 factor (ECF subfamily)